MKLRLSENNPLLAPPWAAEATWQEANCGIEHTIQQHFAKLSSAVTLASTLRRDLEYSFDILDDLCMETCPHCPDPCCLKASPSKRNGRYADKGDNLVRICHAD